MKRENELLLKGATIEITKVLRNFNDTINATLGDTVTVTSHTGAITRPSTLQDTIDLYQNEWCSTVQLLNEIGIEIEAEKDAPKNHYEVYGKLLDLAGSEKETSLNYNEISIRFDNILISENGLGDSILMLHRNDIIDEIARILLKGNKEYQVIENEAGSYLELIEK